MAGDFHGRTTTIVGFSTDPDARGGFGPFTPGFDVVPYGDADALAAAMTPDTVAVLLEPVQGEAGVVVPPPGYLAAVRRICDEAGALMIADEVQSGLGRTGHLLATRAAGVDADVYLLGKALGGGIVPLSAVVADEAVLGVLRPGQHGSTFGGNPLACAVGSAVVDLLADRPVLAHARSLGAAAGGPARRAGRARRRRGAHGGACGRAIDVDPRLGTGRDVCAALARARGAGQGHARRDAAPVAAAGGDGRRDRARRRRPGRGARRPALTRTARLDGEFAGRDGPAGGRGGRRGRRSVSSSGRSAPNSRVSISSAVSSGGSCGRPTARSSSRLTIIVPISSAGGHGRSSPVCWPRAISSIATSPTGASTRGSFSSCGSAGRPTFTA